MVLDRRDVVGGGLTQGAVAEEAEHNCHCVEGHTVGCAGREPKGRHEEEGEEEGEEEQQGKRVGCAHGGQWAGPFSVDYVPRGWMRRCLSSADTEESPSSPLGGGGVVVVASSW